MSKKLVCLLLSVVMLMCVFLTGCGDKDASATTLTTRTLGMFVISDKTVFSVETLDYVKEKIADPSATAEEKTRCNEWIATWVPEGKTFDEYYNEQIETSKQYDAVTEAINLVTKTQFSIQLNITYLAEDVYYEYVNKCIETPNTTGYTGVIDKSVAEENELGVPEYVYPYIPDTQVDILFIGNEEYFNKFYSEGKLSSLSSELSSTYRPLTMITYPSYLQAVTRDGNIYGIPNNVPSGEYKYMLINKELADKYMIQPSDIATWKDCESYLKLVSENEDNCIPILLPDSIEQSDDGVSLEDIIRQYVINNYYWSISYEETEDGYTYKVDPKEFSLLGTGYTINSKQDGTNTSWISFDNMLSVSSHQSQIASLMYYQNKGYFEHKTSDDQKVAITMFEGDITEIEQYEDDYYKVLIDVPRITGSDAYTGMFAVSSTTTSLSKSLQIISYLNTEPSFRNLLQYGIQGENYTVDNNGYVTELESNLYKMDVNKTGNIFNAYAPDDTYTTYDENGNIEDIWGLAKRSVSETIVHPLFNFSFDEALKDEEKESSLEPLKIDNSALDYLSDLTDEYLEKIKQFDTDLSIDEIIEELRDLSRELNKDTVIIKLRDYSYSTKTGSNASSKGTSPYEIYYNWLVRNKFSAAVSGK